MTRFGQSNNIEKEAIETVRFLRTQGATLATIADHMNAQMIPPKMANKWSPILIWNLLNGEAHGR